VNTLLPAPDEPLSPELVLVLPPELRAEAIARLGPPVWPKPRPQVRHVQQAPAALEEPFARSLGLLLGARLAQLALIFFAVTAVTLAMSMVAHAFH
jgi:hypothetical protein